MAYVINKLLFLFLLLNVIKNSVEFCQSGNETLLYNVDDFNSEKYVTVNTELPTFCNVFAKNISFATHLKIDNVHLKQLETGALNLLENLKSLSLEGNEIATLNDKEFYKTNLTKLNIRKNRLKVINSYTFVMLYELEDLDLSSNLITTLNENWFVDCDNLKKLRLFYNFIKTIESYTFKNINSDLYVSLLLGSNKIEKIRDGAFDKLTHIEELTLHDNSLKEIQDDLFAKTEDIHTLDLGANEITCVGDEVLRKCETVFLANDPIDDKCLDIIKEAMSKYNVTVYSMKLSTN